MRILLKKLWQSIRKGLFLSNCMVSLDLKIMLLLQNQLNHLSELILKATITNFIGGIVSKNKVKSFE